MKDEIINNIKADILYCYKDWYITEEEYKRELDYITNLQTIEQQYSAILSENAELENNITNLQEELEHYKQLGLNQKQFEYENKIKILEHNCKQAEESCRQHRLANKNKKRRLERKDKQLERYKNIIDELEKWLDENWNKPLAQIYVADVVEKINELKGE